MANLGKAVATFVLSAAAQAAVKAIMSSGRSPDKKKRLEEQFWTKWFSMFMSEADPLTLIPGYSDLMELAKNGELADDAWSVIGKLKTVLDTTGKWITGKNTDLWRNLEDTVGQVVQLFSEVPAKNISRDIRAMINFFKPGTYADREHSDAMVKYGIYDSIASMDNIIGVVNKYLQDYGAGYGTAAKDYYERIYAAEKTGDEQAAKEMKEYLTLKSTADNPEKQIETNLKSLTKSDKDMTYSEKIKALKDRGMEDSDVASWILSEYKEGKIGRAEAEKLWIEADKKKTKNDAYFKFEQADWEKKTGKNVSDTDWFRVNNAIESGNSAEYNSAVKEMKEHGYKDEDIQEHVKGQITKKYKEGKWTRKETESALKKYRKDMKEDDIWWALDRIDYNKETGKDAGSGQYYRLYDAIEANKSDNIKNAVQIMLKHGKKKDDIKKTLSSKYKQAYLDATGSEKTKLKDALTKAYKAVGLTADEALKIINGWKPKKSK
jgi:hypothetical protein